MCFYLSYFLHSSIQHSTLLFTLVPKPLLGEQCFPQDVCQNNYAECSMGKCKCRAGSIEKNGTCCKYKTLLE